MSEKIKGYIAGLFKQGKIEAFLGEREENGQIVPHLFTGPEEIEHLYFGSKRYPLNKVLAQLCKRYPEATIGVMVRGCDERGLNELYKWNQLDPEKVVAAGIACSKEQAEYCECSKPYPEVLIDGEQTPAVGNRTVKMIESMGIPERLKYWMAEFSRCIKCYGCRDICPMCFCNECSLEEAEFIGRGKIPPEIPVFHLSRAVHMAGRCIDCGLCEEACPSIIPLRRLYKKVNDIIQNHFSYRPGYDDEKSPLNMLGQRPEE
jgi:formate dehydrogenase subunit beta